MLNLAFLASEDGDSRAWHLEDAEFVEAARKHLADWSANHGISDGASQPKPTLAQA